MRKMMKNVGVGTMAGIIVAVMPFTAFASEIIPEEEQAYEMALAETQNEVTGDQNEAVVTQKVIEINLDDPKAMLAQLKEMSDEESMELLTTVGMLYVADPDFRSMFTVSCLEAGGVEMTEEEKDVVDNLVKSITVDDIVEIGQELGTALDNFLGFLA